nr:immunoglobulin heavy chain junction region [Mus musculus]
CLGSTWFAYW